MSDILDKTLLEKRNPTIELWAKVPNWARKVYIFLFTRGEEKFLKVGKTDYMEGYDRVLANHSIFKQGKEDAWVETSMYEHFDTIDLMTSAMLVKDKADKLEQTILKVWGDQDVKLPKMKGMSEFRKYSYDKLKQGRAIIDAARWKG